MKKENYVDLTTVVNRNTTIFPGDPEFQCEKIASISKESSFNLYQINMNNHLGTHIDFPSHVLKQGKSSSDYKINDLIGDATIIEVPKSFDSITPEFIVKQTIVENDIVLFKTKNSMLSKQDPFNAKYVYIEPEAAKVLLLKKIRMVGIDYLSVDAYEASDLPVHTLLLSHNILIIENLELQEAYPGKGKLFVMPLNITEMDGLPARVIFYPYS